MVDVPTDPSTPSAPVRLPRVTPAPAPRLLDDATVHAAGAGDEAAFAEVFAALHPLLRRYATVLVGRHADDVVGEAWLHIARDIRTFQGDVDGFRGWCARIVRNRAIDLVRADDRRPVAPVGLDEGLDAVAPDDTAIDALDNIATSRAVAWIGSLPREQAEAVMLRAVIGMDTRTAADVLGKSPGAVRVAAHRGLRRLASQLRAVHGGEA